MTLFSTILKTALLLLMLMLLHPTHAFADNEYDHDEARELREAGKILPLETILRKVKKEKMGRVLEVELEKKHGRYYYEIELIDSDGTVWEQKIDARTGELKERKQEDD